MCQMSVTDDAVPGESSDAGGPVRHDSTRRLRRNRRNTARPPRHAKSVAVFEPAQYSAYTSWWLGVAVTRFIRSTKLLYAGPG